ncbi:MAG: protoporphyrinogen oxidase [Candidatus Kapabacteria bacterium]|nr:protoporphyrinogen oxidase [Ignavibacteriota bacterium]MCW5885499.1 protoporphyrinogen oxidase [Candidatus Kapabacteria bacterium]
MNDEKKYDAVILGGGLTGLTMAYYLKKAGLKIKVLEKKEYTGGVIRTITEDCFVYETGPNSGIISTIEAVELFEDLKSIVTPEIANPDAKDRWIWKGGKWHSLPAGIIPGIKTELFTLKDKLNLLIEPLKPKGKNPEETIAELVVRRLGQSFLDYAVDPFISGIYAGNPYKLVTKYALPKLYNLEQNYGSFIGGAIRKKFEKQDPKLKKVSREVFSMELGLQNLVDALKYYIDDDNIETNCHDLKVELAGKPYKISYNQKGVKQELESNIVVTSMGGYSISNIFPEIKEDEISEIINLKYTKVVQAVIGYRNWTGIKLKAFGGLVPSKEKRDILGILFISSIFKQRAPEKGALMSVFMGGERRPDIYEMVDEDIKNIALSEVNDMLKPENPAPDFLKIFRYEKAIPQYEESSGMRFKQIEYLENKYQGLYLAGNIRNGIGMADRIAQAKQLSDQIIGSHNG